MFWFDKENPEMPTLAEYATWCEKTGDYMSGRSYQEFLDQRNIDENVI